MKKTNDFLKLKNSSIQKERKSAEVLAEIEEKEIKEERFVSVDNSLKQEKIKPPKIKIIKNKIRASFLKKAGCILSAAILFFLIFYSLLALVITRFNLDNAQSRFLSRYFPVPALISKLGMVGFYDYKDMREAGDNDNLKADLIKEMMKNSGGEIDEIKVWSLVE